VMGLLSGFFDLLDELSDSCANVTISASEGAVFGPDRMTPIPSSTNRMSRLIASASAIPDARLLSGVSSCAERRR
jgi:hypothetical protein